MDHIIVTANGKRLLARAAAGEVSVVFTRAGTSSAEYEEGELESLSELKNLLQQVEISNVEIEDDTTIVISSHVDNRELETGYYITAIGIFAKAEGEEEILYAVSLVSNTPYMPELSATLTGVSFRFTLKVGDSSNITIHVDELTSVTEGEFYAYKMKIDERFAKMEFLEFEDYTSGELDIPDPEYAINQITSGKSSKLIQQYIKAALKGLLNLAQRALSIATGRNQARVFATVAALDAWLAVPDNVNQLNVGDNFYITATDVPDYWWDGTQKQKLETQKVDLTTYDQRIAANANAISELNGNIINDATLFSGCTGSLRFKKIHKTVFFDMLIEASGIESVNNWKRNIAIIPEGFRPASDLRFYCLYDGTSNSVMILMSGTGEVSLLSDAHVNRRIITCGMYFVQ